MTDRRRPRACMQAAGYLADDIGRKPVSERTKFVSAHCARQRKAQARERTNEVRERALRQAAKGASP